MEEESLDRDYYTKVNALTEPAYEAMTAAYINLRNPQEKIMPDWKRGIREKYEGSVYAEAAPDTAKPLKLHIDPHVWANMKAGVMAIIGNALDGLDGVEPAKYLEVRAHEISHKIAREDDYTAFKFKIMLAGVEAARKKIAGMGNGVTNPHGRS